MNSSSSSGDELYPAGISINIIDEINPGIYKGKINWDSTKLIKLKDCSLYDYITPQIAEINDYVIRKLSAHSVNSSRVNYEMLLDRVISKLVVLTKSDIGTVAFQTDKKSDVDCIAFGEVCPGTISIAFSDTNKKSSTGFFSQIINHAEVLIINNHNGFDVPKGHHPITTFIGIPLTCQNMKNKNGCKSILALANNLDGYSDDLVKEVFYFALDLSWDIVDKMASKCIEDSDGQKHAYFNILLEFMRTHRINSHLKELYQPFEAFEMCH